MYKRNIYIGPNSHDKNPEDSETMAAAYLPHQFKCIVPCCCKVVVFFDFLSLLELVLIKAPGKQPNSVVARDCKIKTTRII